MDQDETEAIEHFQIIESSAKKIRLNINYDKTKIMIKNVDNPRTEVIEGKLVMKVTENTTLEVVNDFKYLGAYIVWTSSETEDLHGTSSISLTPSFFQSSSIMLKSRH